MSTPVLKTAATVEPVTLTEVKQALNLSASLGADDDALLSHLVKAAREHGEHKTGAAWVISTWVQHFDRFPSWNNRGPQGDRLELGKHPVQSVVSIQYVDEDGQTTVMSAADYQVVTEGRLALAYIAPAYQKSWPQTRDIPQAVSVEFTAGWPLDTGSPTTPAALKQWLLSRVATLYEHREAFVEGLSVASIPHGFVDGMLDPYGVMRGC